MLVSMGAVDVLPFQSTGIRQCAGGGCRGVDCTIKGTQRHDSRSKRLANLRPHPPGMLEAAGAQHGSHEPPLAPRCGPDRDEWEAHKGRIEILYCERQLPLKDVMKIMQKEHDFHGTYVFSIAGVPLSARPHLLTKFHILSAFVCTRFA